MQAMRHIPALAAELGIVPADVEKAEATVDAARAFRAKVADETEPDLGSLTPGAIAAVHKRLLDHGDHDRRLQAADAIVKAAEDQFRVAWLVARGPLWPLFGEAFAAAVEEFRASLVVLGYSLDPANAIGKPEPWAAMRSAGARLTALGAVRNEYANTDGRLADVGEVTIGGVGLERLTRLVVVPDKRTLQTLKHLDVRPWSVEFFADVLHRGIKLGWHTKADQERIADAMRAASRDTERAGNTVASSLA